MALLTSRRIVRSIGSLSAFGRSSSSSLSCTSFGTSRGSDSWLLLLLVVTWLSGLQNLKWFSVYIFHAFSSSVFLHTESCDHVLRDGLVYVDCSSNMKVYSHRACLIFFNFLLTIPSLFIMGWIIEVRYVFCCSQSIKFVIQF